MTPATPRPRDVTDAYQRLIREHGAWEPLPDGHRVIVLPPGFVVVRDEPVFWYVRDENGDQEFNTINEFSSGRSNGFPLYAPEDPT